MATAEAVRPDEILKQLAAHWRDLGEPGGEGDGLLRACSMTLTCFADDEEDAPSLNEMLESLKREHPSRLIVHRLQDGDDELSARVSAQCWKPFGHLTQSCCEYVVGSASINRLADAASIVAPLAA